MDMKAVVVLVLFAFVATNEALKCLKCDNARTNQQCINQGTIQTCDYNQGSCQNVIRYANRIWSISKGCKQTNACTNNQRQNSRRAWWPVQCHGNPWSGSVCWCCCKSDECNRNLWMCMRGGQNRLAPADPVPGSDDRIDEKRCQHRDTMQNGRVSCSDGNSAGSKCTYTCNSGYDIHGEDCRGGPGDSCNIQCNGNSQRWVPPAPTCRDINECATNNGGCVNGACVNTPGSFRCNCNAGWTGRLCDKDINECLVDNGGCLNGAMCVNTPGSHICECADGWTGTFCGQPKLICELDVKLAIDMVVVLDSSSSITKAVWQQEVELASHIIRSFYVGPDASHVGVFHYNHDVKVVSEIFLNSGLSTTQIQQRLHDIRYKDVGTMTGKALQHALDDSLTVRRGNRAHVYDNLVLITDGRSQDDVSAVAQALKASGAHVFAVGISMKNDGEATVRTVASEPSHALFYPNLNGDSLYDIANQIAAKIHADQCPPGVTCKAQKPVKHAETTCTNENRVGSVCTHVCKYGLTHYPAHKNVTECLLSNDKKSAKFKPSRPCCINATRLATEMCPPLPDLDVVVVVDSSSSVRIHNWGPQIKFVKDIVSMFDVGYDKTRVGVFRYNKLIDQDTEIKLKDATNMTDLLAGIDAIPYDGSGTLTGAAINYTLTHHLSEEYGNRKKVDDFVIVITDGRSQDDVVVPSQLVRDSGAMVFAVGVGLKENGLETMDAIAGNPENSFNIEGGFEALQAVAVEIQDLLKKVVCHPCKRLRVKQFELKEAVAAILKQTLTEAQANTSEENTSEESTSEESTSEESTSEENVSEENASEEPIPPSA